MPANTGTPPRRELVDVRFRNGTVARGVKPSSYRWQINDPNFPINYDYDIVEWQASNRKG